MARSISASASCAAPDSPSPHPNPCAELPRHGERYAGAESLTCEANLASLPLALNEVGDGLGLVTGHACHLGGCQTTAEYCTAYGIRCSPSTLR